ncbi:hypothetical protein A2U01_0074954, partial [Trifolium medium]|nr:hypothetical protein [Trifolium medium]
MEESCLTCGKSSQGCVDAIKVTQGVLGGTRALVDIDA